MITAAQHDRVVDTVNRYMAIAQRVYGIRSRVPAIRYDVRGRTAGAARLLEWEVGFNPVLLSENFEQMLQNTIPHEVAHCVHYALAPLDYQRGSRRQHGPKWQEVMRAFGCVPERCHSMDVSNAMVRVTRYHVYACPECGEMIDVGPKHHARIQMHGRIKPEWRGWRIRSCGHMFGHMDCKGLSPRTVQLLTARQNAKSK